MKERRSLARWVLGILGSLIGLWLIAPALVVIPLVVLAGLFVWLKLTEESDEDALELGGELGVEFTGRGRR